MKKLSIIELNFSLKNTSIVAGILAIIVIGYLGLSKIVHSVDGWFVRPSPALVFKDLDISIRNLSKQPLLLEKDYNIIFNYFIEGINAYRTKEHSQILYPGVPGTRGVVVEGLEGFARTAPMLTTWLISGRNNNIKLTNGSNFDLLSHITNGIVEGTKPASDGYWGDFTHLDQRAVESGDLALVVGLLKEKLNVEFSELELKNIKSWLEQINTKKDSWW